MYYTKEQIEKLKNIDLIKFCNTNGLNLKKENNAYRLLDFDGGLYVFEKNNNQTSGFYWHKFNRKGNAIDFFFFLFNDSYIEALNRLSKASVQSLDSIKSKASVQSLDTNENNKTVQSLDRTKDFKLPERDNTLKQAYSYLINCRKINKAIIDDCIKQGIIRQFKENQYTYVGFIGKDADNKPQYLMLRSTISNSSFKKEFHNSNKKYGFKIFDKNTINIDKKDIYIFESPIDLLSYMSLNVDKVNNNNVFLSMGGISSLALEQFIFDYNPTINSLNICFDNDKDQEYNPGQENALKIKEKYNNKYKVHILKPLYKDYNEDLKNLVQIQQSTQQINSQYKQNKVIPK